MRQVIVVVIVYVLTVPTPVTAQVQLVPSRLEPAAWERVALRVANGDAAIVAIGLELPGALGVLGVEQLPGWRATVSPATDRWPTRLRWTGGRLEAGEFMEFAFLGRLAADVRERDLRVNAVLVRATGDSTSWQAGGEWPPLRIGVSGTTAVSTWAALALAGGAFGVAVLALALALRAGHPTPT